MSMIGSVSSGPAATRAAETPRNSRRDMASMIIYPTLPPLPDRREVALAEPSPSVTVRAEPVHQALAGRLIMAVNVQATLAELFRSHGFPPSVHGDWLFFAPQELLCSGRITREWSDNQRCVQLDISLLLGPDKKICESCAGFGPTRDEAVADALQVFSMYSFHVLLAAFFSDAKNEEVTREQWVVGGEPRQVLLSNLVMRGKYPASLDDVPDLIKAAELHLKGRQLPVGTHWMRLYFARAGETITSEALLDNEPDEALQSTIAAMPWATTTEFYSARYFLILQDGLDVSRAIATISQSEQSADETIRRKLMLHGSTGSQARRLVA